MLYILPQTLNYRRIILMSVGVIMKRTNRIPLRAFLQWRKVLNYWSREHTKISKYPVYCPQSHAKVSHHFQSKSLPRIQTEVQVGAWSHTGSPGQKRSSSAGSDMPEIQIQTYIETLWWSKKELLGSVCLTLLHLSFSSSGDILLITVTLQFLCN